MEQERRLLTPKEMSRFSGFVYLINKISEEERLLAEGQNANFNVQWDESGTKKSQLIFHIDNRLLGIMNCIAFGMYEGNPGLGVLGLRDDPRLKDGAKQALERITERRKLHRNAGLAEVVEIFNRE